MTCGSRVAVDELSMLPSQVHVEEQLTPVERLNMAPFWSTFCGTSNGAWQGTQAAFSPVTGALQLHSFQGHSMAHSSMHAPDCCW